MGAVKVSDYSRERTALGNNILRARKRLGISGTELAGRINSDKSAVSKIENGERSPNFETILKIADALEMPVEALVHGEDDRSNIVWLQNIMQKLSLLSPESQKVVEMAMTAMIEGLLAEQG